jgi:hypothetical protein
MSAFRLSSEVLRRHAHGVVMMMVTVVVRQGHNNIMLGRSASLRQLSFLIVTAVKNQKLRNGVRLQPEPYLQPTTGKCDQRHDLAVS